jgi:riboflavin synthase
VFTGLIQAVGVVKSAVSSGSGIRLAINPLSGTDFGFAAKAGDSVAIDGVCLTAEKNCDDALEFFVTGKTAIATTLGSLKSGDKVNVEPALKSGDSIGGHFVAGHVDSMGKVRTVRPPIGQDGWLEIAVERDSKPYLVSKGSIAVDGISLTLQEIDSDAFGCVLVPETWKRTKLPWVECGDIVNLEFDLIVKAVVRSVSGIIGSDSKLSFEQLSLWGY